MSPDTQAQALALLRTKENPFDILARPQRPDDRFADVHAPELLHEPRQLLLFMIDAYRTTIDPAEANLPPTRAVTIRGVKGSGKTHLLHSLLHREDKRDQLIVCPTHFPLDVPFEEYLLTQLRIGLADPLLGTPGFAFDRISDTICRYLLVQAIRSLDPVSRTHATAVFAKTGKPDLNRFDELCDKLEKALPSSRLSSLAREAGASPKLLGKLIEGHWKKSEPGASTLAVVRRQLFQTVVRWSLFGDGAALDDLTADKLLPSNSTSMNRAEFVARLLRSLVEVCALAEIPVVFAFDNPEQLFRPRNVLDGNLVNAFFSNIAHAIDTTRGILFLFFAEEGLLNVVSSHQDAAARTRLVARR